MYGLRVCAGTARYRVPVVVLRSCGVCGCWKSAKRSPVRFR